MAAGTGKSQLDADEGQSRKRTLSQLYNAIKKPAQSSAAQNKHEGDSDCEFDNDSVSSCEKSFSGDELSDGDLKDIQGEILGAIKRFDDMYNKGSSSQAAN